jgi:Condensation domain
VNTAATVAFGGERGGEAVLTWGQRHVWRALPRHGPGRYFLNCPWVAPVYDKRGLGEVLDALRRLIERHESLRTTFADTPSGPVQRVARSGELVVGLEDAGEYRPLERAQRIADEMSKAIFDPAGQWPLHCRVVLSGGRPAALAFVFSHLAVDNEALRLLSADWRRLLRGQELPPAGWHPMDQVELEATEPYLARSARSVRFWRLVLEEVPLDLFDHPPGQPEDPRYIEVAMESAALTAAAALLAQRWASTTSGVLLAACASVLATVSGRAKAVMSLVHSNRRDPRTRAMVGTAMQDSLFVLDLRGGDLAATCRSADRGALEAYRNTQYDPYAMWAMREEIGSRRGRKPDLDAFFNNRLGAGGWPRLPPSTAAEVDRLAGKTRVQAGQSWPEIDIRLMFNVGLAHGVGQLGLIADTAYLPRDTATSMLLGVEALLVRSLGEDAASPVKEGQGARWLLEVGASPGTGRRGSCPRSTAAHRAPVTYRHLVRAVRPGVDAVAWRGEAAQHGGLRCQVAQLAGHRLGRCLTGGHLRRRLSRRVPAASSEGPARPASQGGRGGR